jgi:hypothetical protein
MKLLRVIVFDGSDGRVFERAAVADEWAISGAFAFAMVPAEALVAKTRQAFANGFLGLPSFGRSTFVSVGEATAADHLALVERLADHLLGDWGAPDREAALAAARDEVAFAADLARDLAINTLLTVRRSLDEAGHIHEEFRSIASSADMARPRYQDGSN